MLQDLSLAHAARRSACQRDDAVGAAGIAARLDLEERSGVPVEVAEELAFETGVFRIRRHRHGWGLRPARPGFGGPVGVVAQPLGQMAGKPQLVDVAQHEIDPGDGRHRLGVHLRVAAGHSEHTLRVATLGEPDLVPAGAIALVGHGAGVDHADVGGLIPVDQVIASDQQGLLHLGGLTLIESATDGAEGYALPLLCLDVGKGHCRPKIASFESGSAGHKDVGMLAYRPLASGRLDRRDCGDPWT